MMLEKAGQEHVRKTSTNMMIHMLLRLMAAGYNLWGPLNAYLKSDTGWINFSLGIRTENDSVTAGIIFHEGNVTVRGAIPEKADVVLHFRTDKAVKKLLSATPTEQIFMMLKSELRFEGNASYLNLLLLPPVRTHQQEAENPHGKREGY